LKCLIVEDDFISRRIFKELLSPFADCDIAINGQEAIDSFSLAHQSNRPYNVIFMDIMMPVIDGLGALKAIRALEKNMEVPPRLAAKIVMTTALDDPRTVIRAFNDGEASSFLVKPITKRKLVQTLRELQLIT